MFRLSEHQVLSTLVCTMMKTNYDLIFSLICLNIFINSNRKKPMYKIHLTTSCNYNPKSFLVALQLTNNL
jgi:hypothetical protein